MHISVVLTGVLAAAVLAHPGHDHSQEMAERNAVLQHSRRDLSHCAAKIKARGLDSRSVTRRAGLASQLMKKSNLNDRALTSLNVSHHSSDSYTSGTSEATIFAANNSCVLSPEVTEGPYYVTGEYIRKDVTDGQSGVPLTVDIQVLDTETCEPLEGVYLEIWHCNSTGVYSGVSASGNGNSATVTSNLNATFLRGVQQTDSDGAVAFDTTFPGHYTGRATHIHVMVHLNATPLANGTLRDTTAAHVGQMFFDQSLISEVEATSPYTSNTQTLMTNADDSILAQEAATSDPFMEYVLLGDSIADGLLAWLSFGVNTTLSKTVSNAATYYATGGETNANANLGGFGGGGIPSGFSGGSFPTGGFN